MKNAIKNKDQVQKTRVFGRQMAQEINLEQLKKVSGGNTTYCCEADDCGMLRVK